jgi:hypothetical protein
MKAPKRPTGVKNPKPYAIKPSTRSQGQIRRHQQTHKNPVIIDGTAWHRIQQRYKEQQQELTDALSSTGLSSITFGTATFGEATLSTPNQNDSRATNLTDFQAAGDGFLPPKSI